MELEKLNPDPDENDDENASAMQWSDVAAKFNGNPDSDSSLDDSNIEGTAIDNFNDSVWKIVDEDKIGDNYGDDDMCSLSQVDSLKLTEWAKEDKKLIEEMGAMELRDETWAQRVTNPQGVVGRAASLEEKLLYQPNR